MGVCAEERNTNKYYNKMDAARPITSQNSPDGNNTRKEKPTISISLPEQENKVKITNQIKMK